MRVAHFLEEQLNDISERHSQNLANKPAGQESQVGNKWSVNKLQVTVEIG